MCLSDIKRFPLKYHQKHTFRSIWHVRGGTCENFNFWLALGVDPWRRALREDNLWDYFRHLGGAKSELLRALEKSEIFENFV
jgi:hypothetical protein